MLFGFRSVVVRVTLLDALDKIIRRHVGTVAGLFGSLFGPGEVTVLAIVFLVHQTDVGRYTHGEVCEEGFASKLGVIDTQGFAFGTVDGVAESAFIGVPFYEHLFGPLELAGGDFETDAAVFFAGEPEFFESEFVVNFGRDSCLRQALLNGLRLGTIVKVGNG